jgi:hypothetical protein
MKPVRVTVFMILSFALPVFCADFYVSTAGSDQNPGTQAQPFATIQHAIDMCPYTGESSTVHLDGSTWFENPELEATNLWYPPDPPPDRPDLTVIGDYNGPNGMGGQDQSIINGCFTMVASINGLVNCTASLSSVTTKQINAQTTCPGLTTGSCIIYIQNCSVLGSTSDGISCHAAGGVDAFYISACDIRDCSGNGITILNADLVCSYQLSSCIVHNNEHSGIDISNMWNPTNCIISNNNINNNNENGINFNNSTIKVNDNILSNNLGYGIRIIGDLYPDLGGGSLSSPGNNTISGNGTYEVYNESPNNIYAKYNHWDDQSEGEMAGGYYNTVDVTRIWDKWEDGSKGYVMWSDPYPTKTATPSLGMLKATFYPSSNTIKQAKAR